MARIRTIKPEFFTSEDIVSVSPLARLFYVSLWCEADREGRIEWKPATFKLRYLPGDACDVSQLADELSTRGLIVIYEADGKKYAEIPTFTRHQVINNRESPSALPARARASSTRAHGSSTRGARVKAAKASRESGREGREGKEPALSRDAFGEFWDSWPKSDRKQDKGKCEAKLVALVSQEPGLIDLILADIEAKKRTDKWRSGYIEAPEVYINNRRWEDGNTADYVAEEGFL